MRIHVVTAGLPPDLDGIGDYTARLAAELAASSARVKVLTRQGPPSPEPIPGVEIEQAFSPDRRASVWAVAEAVARDRPDWLLLQYQPFAYGRWGLNPYLPAAVARAKRLSPDTRFALMVHEPFVSVESWKFAAMTTWQRWQLYALGRAAECVFFSIEPWTRRFSRWFPGKPVMHLPVPSNLPRLDLPRLEARRRLGLEDDEVVLGLFGQAHPARMLDRVGSAVRAASAFGPVRVLYLGPHAAAVREATPPDVRLIADGLLPPEEVSRRLPAIDVFISAFYDGVSTRRTSMMAALQHGLAVVGTRGYLTDPMLEEQHGRALLLVDAKDGVGFASHVAELAVDLARRDALGGAARRLYDERFSSPRVVARLLHTLSIASAPGDLRYARPLLRRFKEWYRSRAR